MTPRSFAGLWECEQDEWNKITVETCQNLSESEPQQINAALKARGYNTEYYCTVPGRIHCFVAAWIVFAMIVFRNTTAHTIVTIISSKVLESLY